MEETRPVTNGAELVRRLKESGTPADEAGPLSVARACLARVRKKGRVAAAAEVVKALEDALGPDHGTVKKAKRIAATGSWEEEAAAAVPIEEQLLAEPPDGAEAAEPEPEGGPEPEAEPEAEPEKPKRASRKKKPPEPVEPPEGDDEGAG